MDTMTEDEIRNSTEFAEWITRYNKLNHADLTTKTAPYYLFVDYLTLISSDESETIDELTAENAKLRAELAEAKRLLRNAIFAHDNDLYFRLAEAHEWLTVNDNTTAA